ncbi:MAG: TRAP transporter small permease [Salinarimonadaceae bacterium]|nr:MAG: TRAP transporter small permease [Salinarimonadaceae bacterium]
MDRVLTRIETVIMCSAFVGAFAIGTMQVILRYVFNTGYIWTEFALVTLTIIAALTGGSRAITEGLHIRISVFADSLPRKLRAAVDFLALSITLIYCILIGYYGYLYVEFLRRTGAVSIQSGVPLWVVYGIVPFMMVLFVLRYIQRLVQLLRHGEVPGLDQHR